MNDSLYKNGYVVLENFFTQRQIDFFMNQVVEAKLNNDLTLGKDADANTDLHPMSWNVNSHPVWQNTLYSVLPQVSKVTDEILVPTYSYQRTYIKGAEMSHHTDWPWCQISITVNIGQSHPYPLYVTDFQTGKYVKINQKPGDALLYMGYNTSHHRKKFEGDFYSQLFLHYIIDNNEMQQYKRFDEEIFNFELKENMEKVFYTDGVKKIKNEKFSYNIKEEDKNKIIPYQAKMMRSTNRNPRIDINDFGTDISLRGGQYKTKQLYHFMDSIHQTKNSLEPKFCNDLIDLYEDYAERGDVFHGMTHRGLDNDYKNTGEMNLMDVPEGKDFTKTLQSVSDHCIMMYIRKFGLMEHYDPFEITAGGAYYPMWEVHKYEKGIGHYEAWHTEGANLYEYGNRIFVSMFYLNDVEEGGRTVFPFTGNGIKCEEGKHLAFPCYWPYVHYAQTPLSSDKYIITTWLQSVWPEEYQENFVRTEGHDKDKDIRKTKFIWDKGG